MNLRTKWIGTKFRFKSVLSSLKCVVLVKLMNYLVNSNVLIIVAVIMSSIYPSRLRIRQPRNMGSRIGSAILVILITVNSGYHISGASFIPEPGVAFSRNLSRINDTSISSITSNVSHRTPKQMNFIATTIRTMGCVPKFFCAMNIKPPTTFTSTMNDLSYLIKFAMTDAYDEINEGRQDNLRYVHDDDSVEDIDPELRTDSEERRDHKRIEKKAEDILAQSDPGLIKFMRGSSKRKRKHGANRMDQLLADEALESAIGEEENKSTSRISALFSGVKNMFRLGKSFKHRKHPKNTKTPKNKTKPFWQSKEFRQQMLLASKIAEFERSGEAPEDSNICSSTFDLCPYTYDQMMGMIKGEPVPTNKPEIESTTSLNGITVSRPGKRKKQFSKLKPMTQPEKEISNMFPPNWAVNRINITSTAGVGKDKGQPIIYVVHPEGMVGIKVNSNSTPTPTTTKKKYSIKPKPSKNTAFLVQPTEQEVDDDENTQNWTDQYLKDTKKGIKDAFSILQQNFSNKTRPFEKENDHKSSKIKPTATPPPTRQPLESESDSGSEEEDDQDTINAGRQPYRKKTNNQKHKDPQNSEASQSQEDQPSEHDDDQENTSSSEEGNDDEIEERLKPNVTIVKPNKYQSNTSKKPPPFENNNKDTSDEDGDEPQENDDKTSEEDENESEEEEKIVWPEKTRPSTTSTTPTPSRRTTQKYKLNPQTKSKQKHFGEIEGNSLKGDQFKLKDKNKSQNQKRRPSPSSAQENPHQHNHHKKHYQNFSAGYTELVKLKNKTLSKRPPKTTTTLPPMKSYEKDQDSSEALEEYSEEPDSQSPPPTSAPPTQPPRPLTTTRKSRPKPTPAKSYSSITTPYTEPEYGFLSSLSSESLSNAPVLSDLPVPSPISSTSASYFGSNWNTNNSNNFPFPSLLMLTSPTPSSTASPMNLFSAMSQAGKVRKGSGKPFGHLLNNILNSSSTAQVLAGVESYSEDEGFEPYFTSLNNFDSTEDDGHRKPQFWNDYETQKRQHEEKISQNIKPSFNQNVLHRRPSRRPMRQRRPNSQNLPQRLHHHTGQGMRHPVEERYPFNQQDMNTYSNQHQFPSPEQQEWPSYSRENWSTPAPQNSFQSEVVNIPRRPWSSREQFIAPSRHRVRDRLQNIRRPTTPQIRPAQNVRRRPIISSRERYKTRFSYDTHREHGRGSAEEHGTETNLDYSPPFQVTEKEIQAKEVLLNQQQKLQLEFAARLHDLAKQQLKLAQRQTFRQPSSKENHSLS